MALYHSKEDGWLQSCSDCATWHGSTGRNSQGDWCDGCDGNGYVWLDRKPATPDSEDRKEGA